ncbi:unnamed protein product [Protopolystoma xenopodis]|uniref:Uncharacterized protein n=1 Tax=Protopolystoma xenopodis TaxID=117903 RepID=A0A448WF91_9PLAT|nr:unnamed protein product [Protopolystoma xenopodis]
MLGAVAGTALATLMLMLCTARCLPVAYRMHKTRCSSQSASGVGQSLWFAAASSAVANGGGGIGAGGGVNSSSESSSTMIVTTSAIPGDSGKSPGGQTTVHKATNTLPFPAALLTAGKKAHPAGPQLTSHYTNTNSFDNSSNDVNAHTNNCHQTNDNGSASGGSASTGPAGQTSPQYAYHQSDLNSVQQVFANGRHLGHLYHPTETPDSPTSFGQPSLTNNYLTTPFLLPSPPPLLPPPLLPPPPPPPPLHPASYLTPPGSHLRPEGLNLSPSLLKRMLSLSPGGHLPRGHDGLPAGAQFAWLMGKAGLGLTTGPGQASAAAGLDLAASALSPVTTTSVPLFPGAFDTVDGLLAPSASAAAAAAAMATNAPWLFVDAFGASGSIVPPGSPYSLSGSQEYDIPRVLMTNTLAPVEKAIIAQSRYPPSSQYLQNQQTTQPNNTHAFGDRQSGRILYAHQQS